MSRHDDGLRLRHMLRYSREIMALTRGKARADLDRERLLNLALVRLIEIIGEAAYRVSTETRAAHPEIPWAQITSMRNRLIHGYDWVDFDILWQTVIEDIPELAAVLEPIVSREYRDQAS
jgi:uncharacterized protein with HEPN domain